MRKSVTLCAVMKSTDQFVQMFPSSSSFGSATFCGFSPFQPSLSKFFCPQVSPSSFLLSAFLDLPCLPLLSWSSYWSSSHSLQSNSFGVGLAWSIHWICPSHLILCALMNLTISAPSVNMSISMLFHILHILSKLTGPDIFLSTCLSRMCRLLSSFVVNTLRTGLLNCLNARSRGLTFRHRASCLQGQAFHYSPENAFYIFNQQIYLII